MILEAARDLSMHCLLQDLDLCCPFDEDLVLLIKPQSSPTHYFSRTWKLVDSLLAVSKEAKCAWQ